MQRGQGAIGSDFENRSVEIGSAVDGGSVEIPVRALHQVSVRIGPVCAIGQRTELVKRGERAAGRDLEDRSTTDTGTVLIRHSSVLGYAVEVSVRGLDQR